MSALTIAVTSHEGIDLVMSLPIGAEFTVHGRTFVKRTYSVDGYAETSAGGERMVFGVWNATGTATGITVRPGDRVEVVR